MKKSLFSFSLVFCMIAGLLGGAVTAGAAQNSQPIIEGKIDKISTIYAGEIFVSGKSQMKYLYSDDISYHYAVFANLKKALKDTAFYDLVPTVAQNAPSSTGVAISSSHQEDMGVDWKSATTVARHYYSGTPGSETNVNMYDYSASYKKEVETLQSGFCLIIIICQRIHLVKEFLQYFILAQVSKDGLMRMARK